RIAPLAQLLAGHLRQRLRDEMLRQMVRDQPGVVGVAPAPGQIGFVGGEAFADGRRTIGGGIGITTGERTAPERGLLIIKHRAAVALLPVVGVPDDLLPAPALAVGGDGAMPAVLIKSSA